MKCKHIAVSTSSARVCLGERHPAPSSTESRFTLEVLFVLSLVVQMHVGPPLEWAFS